MWRWLRISLFLFLLGVAGFTGLIGFSAYRFHNAAHLSAVPALRYAEEYMVSAADPYAVQAGLEMLRRGGSALDAAVAVQMVLTFVEPPESSIGGGGFLLYREGASGKVTVYDGREIAPHAATPQRFLLPGGFRMPFWVAVVSGRSVGVPGIVAMLNAAHQEHGNLSWDELFGPVIEMAERGIPMPLRLQEQVAKDPSLWLFRDTRRFFATRILSRQPMLINPELGQTMRIIAQQGSSGFYEGELAGKIAGAVNSRWIWPGDMTLEDLSSYRPEKRKAVCGNYRAWTVCTIPPPSSGGVTVLQILGILEHFNLSEMKPNSLEAVHIFAEASRLAHIDQYDFIGDPEFVDVSFEIMLDKDYLKERARLIQPQTALPAVQPGQPAGGLMNEKPQKLNGNGSSNTTHFSIVDGDGNVAAMTSSIEVSFGNRNMVGGFMLNSQLTDFFFEPYRDDSLAANAVGPGKRPRSWMSPTIVMDSDGEIRLIIGSRGGSSIVAYVAKTIIGVLDWNLSLQEAISLPNIVARGPDLLLEKDTVVTDLTGELVALGHRVKLNSLVSGLHGMERIDKRWRSGVDPRLGGAAAGK